MSHKPEQLILVSIAVNKQPKYTKIKVLWSLYKKIEKEMTKKGYLMRCSHTCLRETDSSLGHFGTMFELWNPGRVLEARTCKRKSASVKPLGSKLFQRINHSSQMFLKRQSSSHPFDIPVALPGFELF
jgi:hypothetical protein